MKSSTNRILVKEVRSYFRDNRKDLESYFSKLLDKEPVHEFVKTFMEATIGFSANDLGWTAFPALLDLLRTHDELFTETLKLVEEMKLDYELGFVLLDFLDNASRFRKKREAYWRMLHNLAESNQHTKLRAKAIRHLARNESKLTLQLLDRILRSKHNNLELVDAVAYVASWAKNKRIKSKNIYSRLVNYALSKPKQALHAPSLIHALVQINVPPKVRRKVLNKITSKASTDEEYTLLLRAADSSSDNDWLSELISKVAAESSSTPKSDFVIKSIFVRDSLRLEKMYKSEYYTAYLYVCSLSPESYRSSADYRMRLRNNNKLAQEAAHLDHTLVVKKGLNIPNAFPAVTNSVIVEQDNNLFRVLSKERDEKLLEEENEKASQSLARSVGSMPSESMSSPIVVHPAFSTGLQVGDAIYRDLITQSPFNRDHWHTGLYFGFKLVDYGKRGIMEGINVDKPLDDCVEYIFVEIEGFWNPTADMASLLQQLRRDFLAVFADGSVGFPFHGSRRPPNLSLEQRKNIVATATSFLGKKIDYTFADMLDYNDWTWDGTIDDIDEIRCDGIVEYCYEANGIRLCGGEDGSRWNISRPGIKFPENHNDFHNHDYNPGELCPRIQAGDKGDEFHRPANDTTFIKPPDEVPDVSEFQVFGPDLSSPPSIWFRINSSIYDRAYVRITVSKDRGPRQFASISRYPWSTDYQPSTNTPIHNWWTGVGFADGSYIDYIGQDGIYNFEIVAIDYGGNVSAAKSIDVEIKWPPTGINCIIKNDRRDPYSRIESVGGIYHGRKWFLTLDQAIAAIENGRSFYVEQPAGDRVKVIVQVSAYGNKYLKTEADGDLPNNLLELPTCIFWD